MSVDDFIELCKDKIETYIDSSEEYDIYTIWKDYWTLGNNTTYYSSTEQRYISDSAPSYDNQRAIFGNTLNSSYFDCTYNGAENKLYMKVYTITDTETYTLSS